MEGKQFAKLVKDIKILDKKVTATDIDLIFAKIKDKAARRISFDEFMNGLDLVAQRKGLTGKQIRDIVSQSQGPILVGTKAEAVKYHDDKTLYTGVHANGGPSTVDKEKISDISQLCDRTESDVRGQKLQPVSEITNQHYSMVVIEEEQKQMIKKVAPKQQDCSMPQTLEHLFGQFS